MRLAAGITLLAGALPAAGHAQGRGLEIVPQAAFVSHSEVDSDLQFGGVGFGGTARFTRGRFTVGAEGFYAWLDPVGDATATASYTMRGLDLRLTYRVVPAIAVEVGAAGRQASPAFAAPDVGYLRLGLRSESRLARLAKVWVRGGYLVAPRFNGGGSAGFAFDIGVGSWIGLANGRYGLRFDYDFQRIDRTVNDIDVPLQMMIARVGFEVHP